VITKSGAVTGGKSGAVWAWKGIPYAAPPVGALRWKPPAETPCWSGERDATALGPKCTQVSPEGSVVGQEDCLTLNVWAPDGAKDAPVLVYIHGGSNLDGSASNPTFDGTELATRAGVVVVTLEYRVGPFGFFSHASLDAESPLHVSGNYGILDQIAALKWVQANIAGFGGAPAKVMLFGQSAGAEDTLVHVASPLSKGLFAAAISESGGGNARTLAQSETAMQAIVDAVGCTDAPDVLACLRAQTAEELVTAVDPANGPLDQGLKYAPVVDGYVLTGTVLQVITQGQHNHVPLVLGTNEDETGKAVPKVTTEAEYEAAVKAQYGATRGAALLTQYPASRFATPRQALVRLTTDVTWTCPMRIFARQAAQHQTEPVYRYWFTWSPPGAAGQITGASHGIELPFVFHNFTKSGIDPTTDVEQLSQAVEGYWTRLAATGDPNGAGAVAWPAYAAATDPYLELGSAIQTGAGLSTADCDFIESLLP
jgi:para-nitrobenzyl esterase